MTPKFRFRSNVFFTILVSLLACGLVCVGVYAGAASAFDSVFAYRSPLRDAPPQPGPSLGVPATRRVVWVLIDGLRLDVALQAEVMPTLNRLRAQGASAQIHSRPFSFSQPGYATLLTGAWTDLNGGPAVNVDYDQIPTLPQDEIFSAARRAGIRTALWGNSWFGKLLPASAVSASSYGSDEIENALTWLGQDFGLVLVHLEQVDSASHYQGGPFSPGGLAAASEADQQLAEIVARLDLTRDTLLICSDHGHIATGGHGGNDPVTLVEPLVLAGAAVRPGSYGDVQMVDVAPTITTLLGANLPAAAQGRPLQELLALPPAIQAALPAAIAAQQTRLIAAYTRVIGQPLPAGKIPPDGDVAAYQSLLDGAANARLSVERLPRWLAIGLILLLVIGLVTRVERRRLAWALGGALLALAVFHLRYAILDGHPYSLSWPHSEMEMFIYVAQTALMGLGAGWLVALIGLGGLRRGRSTALAATLAYLLAVLSLLLIPIAISYAVNGFILTWILPDFSTYFIGFLSLLQVGVSAAGGMVLIVIAALLENILNRFRPLAA